MERLRRGQRPVFSGFTKVEIKKMEKLLKESDQPLRKGFFKKVAKSLSSSAARAGKPAIKWTEVQNWFENRPQDCPAKVASSTDASNPDIDASNPDIDASNPDIDASNHYSALPESNKTKESSGVSEGETVPDSLELKFEARSSKDMAWYDVDKFLSSRIPTFGEIEVRVRFAGFGAEDDEWVNAKTAVRERFIPFEDSECGKLMIGDLVCCFKERSDEAKYFDAHILNIKRKSHDMRDCRCLFLVQYDHDNTEETVRLKSLYYDPIFIR